MAEYSICTSPADSYTCLGVSQSIVICLELDGRKNAFSNFFCITKTFGKRIGCQNCVSVGVYKICQKNIHNNTFQLIEISNNYYTAEIIHYDV